MKGADYSKIKQWYLDIFPCVQHLATLIDQEKEQNAASLTLNILKIGLFSKELEVIINCVALLTKVGQEINSIGG